MELVGEVVLLGIVESTVSPTPIEIATAAFHGSPFRFVLTGNLIPQLKILWHASTSVHVASCRDVAQELVRVAGQSLT